MVWSYFINISWNNIVLCFCRFVVLHNTRHLLMYKRLIMSYIEKIPKHRQIRMKTLVKHLGVGFGLCVNLPRLGLSLNSVNRAFEHGWSWHIVLFSIPYSFHLEFAYTKIIWRKRHNRIKIDIWFGVVALYCFLFRICFFSVWLPLAS